jgi:hypothetical protein
MGSEYGGERTEKEGQDQDGNNRLGMLSSKRKNMRGKLRQRNIRKI